MSRKETEPHIIQIKNIGKEKFSICIHCIYKKRTAIPKAAAIERKAKKSMCVSDYEQVPRAYFTSTFMGFKNVFNNKRNVTIKDVFIYTIRLL